MPACYGSFRRAAACRSGGRCRPNTCWRCERSTDVRGSELDWALTRRSLEQRAHAQLSHQLKLVIEAVHPGRSR